MIREEPAERERREEIVNVADAHTIFLARENGSRKLSAGQPISVDEVVDLLVEGAQNGRHAAIRRNANRLLAFMAEAPWWLLAGSHQGGFGGAKRPPDENWHITLKADSGKYHLRQDKRKHLFEITGPKMEEIPPWLAPGA